MSSGARAKFVSCPRGMGKGKIVGALKEIDVEPVGLLNAAIAHHRAGRFAEAERGYESVLALDPENVDALNMLGVIKAMKNHLEQAEQLIAKALQRAPKAPLVLLNYGNVLSAQGRELDALENYDKALALAPNMLGAWMNRASSLRALGRRTDALASVDRALTLSRATADLYSLRG